MVSGCKELILWGAGSFQDVMEEEEEDSEEIMAEVVEINQDQLINLLRFNPTSFRNQ